MPQHVSVRPLHMVADSERLHYVECMPGMFRPSEHIAAGVQHEIRRLDGRWRPTPILTQSSSIPYRVAGAKARSPPDCRPRYFLPPRWGVGGGGVVSASCSAAHCPHFRRMPSRAMLSKKRGVGRHIARLDACPALLQDCAFCATLPGRCRDVPGSRMPPMILRTLFPRCRQARPGTSLDAFPDRVQASGHFFHIFSQGRLEWTSFVGCMTSSRPANGSASCGT